MKIRKLIWLEILFQLCATALLAHAARLFFLFACNDFSPTSEGLKLAANEKERADIISQSGYTYGEIFTYYAYTNLSGCAGVILSFIICLIIAVVNRTSYLNPFMVLIVGYVYCTYVNNGNWEYQVASFFNFNYWLIIIGGILTIIGLVLLFSKWTIKLIKKLY